MASKEEELLVPLDDFLKAGIHIGLISYHNTSQKI